MKIFETKQAIAAFSDSTDGDLAFYDLTDEGKEKARLMISSKLNRELPLPVYVNQVHKNDVVQVLKNQPFPDIKTNADGLITSLENTPIGVYTADCTPLLFASDKAVAAVHAGWKSTRLNIGSKAVESFGKNYGVNPNDITVWIGPCIGQCCLEMGDEVYEQFVSVDESWSQFFKRMGKWHLNMRALNRYQLNKAGIPDNQIIDYDECTFCHGEKYFSYRRQKARNGSMFSFIVKKV